MADEEKPVPAQDEAAAPESVTVEAPQAEPIVLPPQRDEPPTRRGGFVAPFLGGVAAAALGFGLSHFNIFGLRADLDSDAVTASLARLETRLDAESKTSAGASKEAADQAGAALKMAQDGLASVEDKLATLSTRLEGFDGQLKAQAEALPDGSIPPAAFAALKAEVEALKAAPGTALDPGALSQQINAELDARAAEVAAEAERAAEATRQTALRDAAWIALNEAVKNGQPYADALTATGVTEVPASLAAHAATGLPGLQQLAESFPEAARVALEDSLRADEAGGFGDRALSLLRVTTGQRSLTPQEGTDPDAVLSRAEAAVKSGDLATALTELKGLPPAGQEAMKAWATQAQDRIDAEAALAALKP